MCNWALGHLDSTLPPASPGRTRPPVPVISFHVLSVWRSLLCPRTFARVFFFSRKHSFSSFSSTLVSFFKSRFQCYLLGVRPQGWQDMSSDFTVLSLRALSPNLHPVCIYWNGYRWKFISSPLPLTNCFPDSHIPMPSMVPRHIVGNE